MTQISFRTLDPNIRHNPESASKITADPRSTAFSKFANPLYLPQKSTAHTPFLRPRPSIRKPIHPPLKAQCPSCLSNVRFFNMDIILLNVTNVTTNTNELDKKIVHSKIRNNKLLAEKKTPEDEQWKWTTAHHFDLVTGWQEIKIHGLVKTSVLVDWFVCLFACVCWRFIVLGVFLLILQGNSSKLTAVVIYTRLSGTLSFQKRILSHIKHITGLLPHRKTNNVPRRNLKTQLYFYDYANSPH